MKVLAPILGKLISDLGESTKVSADVNIAYTAGRFYQQGLEQYDVDPELAYLSFVNAGEVLASNIEIPATDLDDPELTALVTEIDKCLQPGTAQKLRQKLFGQISRKFRVGLKALLNENFYSGSEATQEWFKLTPATISNRLKAAYGLRSQFLHAGLRFGHWVIGLQPGAEVSVGTPAYGSDSWKKLISEIPSLQGLERLIRFALLRFVHQRITPVHPKLSNDQQQI